MTEEEKRAAKLADRIDRRLEALDRSSITAALNVGLERTYIRDFVIGRKKSLGTKKLELVAKALDWTVAELTDIEAPTDRAQSPSLPGRTSGSPTLVSHTEDIPVLGVTMGGAIEHDRSPDFWMNGEVINYVARPKGILNAPNVFALYVSGNSMFPRFRERDLVFAQKASPAAGDDVVIELKPISDGEPHPSFIKEFVRPKGSYILVKQYNPPAEIEFALDEIRNVFRVIPLKELVG